MATIQLAPPYPVFTDKNGDPLDNGYLYFGVIDLNPETNPIQVYYDSAFTQPVAQPIRTSNGYPMRNGAPALIFAGSQFSVTVRDKNSDLVIYSPVGYGVDPGSIAGVVVVQDQTGDGVTTAFGMGASPSSENATNAYIDGVYQNKSTYSISGSTLTFSEAPPLYSAIEIVSNQTAIIGGTDAGLVTYNEGDTGAVDRTVKAKLQETVSVKDFGAVGDGVTDDTAAIQNAIDAASHIIIPSGTYAIDAAIQIGLAKTVELLSGATVKRFAALSSSTGPVFWLAENRSSLIGAGQGVSLVENENASPRGVVRIGAEDITEAGRNVQYSTLRGLFINGKQVGGQTAGTPDACIYMVAGSGIGSSCYYNSVSNCRVSQANFGIYMHGLANANRIYDIGGQSIGNASLKSAMLYMAGGIDNAISNFFLTGSSGTTMVKWEDQGAIRTTHNSFTNMVCEQGGGGLWLDADTGTTAVSNYFQGVPNTSPALNISNYVLNNNVIVNQTANRPINVQFPPTASASGDATTLDDYREGQWTPEIDSETAGSGRVTTVNSAWYVKIGRMVHVFCHIELATLGAGGSGNLVVRGLPFTSLSDSSQHASGLTVARFTGLGGNVVNIAGEIKPGDTIVRLRGATAAAAGNAALAFSTYAQASMTLTLTGTYIAAS
jgi:hypothetical protein